MAVACRKCKRYHSVNDDHCCGEFCTLPVVVFKSRKHGRSQFVKLICLASVNIIPRLVGFMPLDGFFSVGYDMKFIMRSVEIPVSCSIRYRFWSSCLGPNSFSRSWSTELLRCQSSKFRNISRWLG